MMVFDREGTSCDRGVRANTRRAHGVHIAPDDTMFLTDDGGHFCAQGHARRQSPVGARRAGQAGALYERRAVSSLYAHGAVAPGRYLCLGRVRQSRVHKYTPTESLCCLGVSPAPAKANSTSFTTSAVTDGWVYVADRENHRVRWFDGNGKYETQWQNLHRPCGLCMPYGHQTIFMSARSARRPRLSETSPISDPRVSIVDHQGS